MFLYRENICALTLACYTYSHISEFTERPNQVYANFGQYNGFEFSPGEPANFNAFSKYILMDTGLIGFLNHKFYGKCHTRYYSLSFSRPTHFTPLTLTLRVLLKLVVQWSSTGHACACACVVRVK